MEKDLERDPNNMRARILIRRVSQKVVKQMTMMTDGIPRQAGIAMHR